MIWIMINNEGIKSNKLLKKFFNWFNKYNKTRDVSSLIVFTTGLSFLNLFDYRQINNPLSLLPFLFIVLLVMRFMDEGIRILLKQRNKKLSNSYFYVAIFIVVTLTVFIKN
jgi:hypothetical protein